MERWERWMEIGRKTGCHQRADRSFFYHGYQCPVCARCTGVIPGFAVSVLLWPWKKTPAWICILMSAVMAADWGVQRIGWKESTNTRRFVTGCIGGFGWNTLYLHLLRTIRHRIRNAIR